VRYRFPTGTGGTLVVPLIMPVDGVLKRNQAQIMSAGVVRATSNDPAFSAVSDTTAPSRERLILASRERQSALRLELQGPPQRTTVDFAWIQTWFAGNLRQDRVAYGIDSPETVLRLALPEGVDGRDVDLWIDGAAVSPGLPPGAPGELLVDLGAGKKPGATVAPGVTRRFLVEVLYSIDGPPRPTGRTEIEGPRWLGSVRTQRSVWQVVFPPNEHVVLDPEDFTPEYVWGWYPVIYFGDWPLKYWGRRPRWEQADQQRLTASSRADTLRTKTNRYAYSTLGAAERIELYTAPRSVIMLVASGCVLAIGLAFLLAPASRRPVVLLLLAVALAALAIYSPAWAILLAQASVLGVLLVAVAALLKRILGRKRPVWLGAAGNAADRSSATHTVVRRDGSSRVTTTTAPLDFDAAVDVKP
jgi:hypothetical protein